MAKNAFFLGGGGRGRGGGGGRSCKLIFKTKNPSLKKIFFWGRGEGEMNFFDEMAMNPFFFSGGGGWDGGGKFIF